MTDLDTLEMLAREAQAHSERIGEDEWFSQCSVQSLLLAHPDDAAFVAACSPEVVLRLVAIARAAENGLEALVNARDYVNAEFVSRSNLYAAYPHRWASERDDLRATDATIAALREALEAK